MNDRLKGLLSLCLICCLLVSMPVSGAYAANYIFDGHYLATNQIDPQPSEPPTLFTNDVLSFESSGGFVVLLEQNDSVSVLKSGDPDNQGVSPVYRVVSDDSNPLTYEASYAYSFFSSNVTPPAELRHSRDGRPSL